MISLRKFNGKAMLGTSAALLAIALPSAGFAFGSLTDPQDRGLPESFLAFTPADADPRLAEFIAQRSGEGRMLRFTPAGAAAAPAARSITVAVRVDQQTADALAANVGIGSQQVADARMGGVSVTPTRYNLGLARGYSSFAQAPEPVAARPIAGSSLSQSISRAEMPDLAEFAPRSTTREDESRFAARIELDGDKAKSRVASGESLSDQMLDVAGSYRLTRNLDITAGVRYEQDRDYVPVPDLDQQDSQAVYVGTQFRF
ncbi:hypothetical protein [Aurantiacibacter poecillastricola]|uniref:hypothetical protein n=1 Tax=Aurantiacibacter poecillastricola TaxID=3064385 RepID=UPI00273FF879|nr:hypothetical protein [Aurantiacibacter sp. 219JJ12-13]MDP5260690.1 hypothetical protein [Aurantiacibacter sp. 219JJ12-13]